MDNPSGINSIPPSFTNPLSPPQNQAIITTGKNFSHAIDLANSTEFALTGGVFSRTPYHLQKTSKEFRVGNLYLNRGCTNAIVGRQPFEGFRMSGGGTKAGGPDYLLQFLDLRVVTENTLRQGFQSNISSA